MKQAPHWSWGLVLMSFELAEHMQRQQQSPMTGLTSIQQQR